MSSAQNHEVAVVGVGMLGASAARHLADAGCDVLLVGQPEPTDRRSQPEDFAGHAIYSSHDDVARVSRVVDPDPVRAWLGNRSVDQFAELAARTGIIAVNPVGHLWAEAAHGLDLVASSGERFELGCIRRGGAATAEAFPYLDLSGGPDDRALESLWEPPPAGSVDPRAYVQAEAVAAVNAGATHVRALVDAVAEASGRVEITTDAGIFTADKVLLATGAFSGHGTSPAAGLDLEYALHTQLLVHLDDAEAERLSGMPSIIGKHADPTDDFYLTPPVSDPGSGSTGSDALFILKIGSPQDDHVRASAVELAAWFRTEGDPVCAARLTETLARLLPGLRDVGRWTTSCVTTYTPSGHPYIDWLDGRSERVACAVGGNGYAAKCAPALGGLAAGLLLDRPWPTEVDRDLFRTRFRD